MRRAVPAVAAACLLAGPTVLAFFSGGYFTEPRLIAAIVAWALVIALALVGPAPLPRATPGRLALGGLALMTVWTAVSIAWAPLGGPAVANVQRLTLYVGALLVAVGALRRARAMRAVEPALAAGATIVIGYGLAGRLLPGIVHLHRSLSAGGRLEQPITYWNAEGALAAVGLVLCARVAGDATRPRVIRMLAAAGAAPLGAGVYLSFSRGALAAGVTGLVVLVAAAPSRGQLRAAALALATAVAAALACAPFAGVASLSGGHRGRDGAIVLVILVALAGAAALTARRPPAEEPLPRARRLAPAAAVVAAAVAVGLVIGALAERGSAARPAAGANPSRLTSVSSNRYDYWRVGLRAFADHPLQGLGAGGFRVVWLRERPILEPAKDIHSLELEMAVELGLVGFLAFAAFLTGVVLAARRALARRRALAAGCSAAALTWLLHASIDWDWELPAVSLPAIVLAGALIALSEGAPDAGHDERPAPEAAAPLALSGEAR